MKTMITVLLLVTSVSVVAETVTITNVTNGQIFSPPVVGVHNKGVRTIIPHTNFLGREAGQPVAELADARNWFLADAWAANKHFKEVAIFLDPIHPGETHSIEIGKLGNNRVAIAAMLVSTNDGFLMLNHMRKGNHIVHAWDAGAEANEELCDGQNTVPGPPCHELGGSNGGSRHGGEGYIYPHPGIRGDGDLPSAEFGWAGPVAIVTVK